MVRGQGKKLSVGKDCTQQVLRNNSGSQSALNWAWKRLKQPEEKNLWGSFGALATYLGSGMYPREITVGIAMVGNMNSPSSASEQMPLCNSSQSLWLSWLSLCPFLGFLIFCWAFNWPVSSRVQLWRQGGSQVMEKEERKERGCGQNICGQWHAQVFIWTSGREPS